MSKIDFWGYFPVSSVTYSPVCSLFEKKSILKNLIQMSRQSYS